MDIRKPKVSVLMPVYNGRKYLREAIDSILKQTYRRYEFIIIDDGSSDDSAKIIESYADERIKFVKNEKNLGLSSTLNKGIDMATGEYIIRMDSDDISLPERIEKQVNFMDNNPDVGVCGTWIRYIGISSISWTSKIHKFPVKHRDIKARSLFNCNFCHPSVIMRKSLLDRFNLRYNPEHLHTEDYGLWQKCSFYFSLANIPEILLLYRISLESITNSDKTKEFESIQLINRLNIKKFDLDFSSEELLIYRNFPINFKKEFLIDFHSWLKKLQDANSEKQIYPEPEFSLALSDEWFSACYRSSSLGLNIWFLFWKLPFSKSARFENKQVIKFFLNCITKRQTQKPALIKIPVINNKSLY